MAVTSARIIRSREWSDDDQNGEKGQRVYLVRCSDKVNDTPDVAALACPGPGSSWSPTKRDLRVAQRDAKERDDVPADGGTLYEVTLDYETKSGDLEQREVNPLDRAPVVRLSFDTFEEPVTQTVAAPYQLVNSNGTGINVQWKWGKKLCNSAGDPFDPSITEAFRDPVLTVTKNLPYLPFDLASQCVDRINSQPFTIRYRGRTYRIDTWQAWLFDISSDPRTENGVDYEECQLVMRFRKDLWVRSLVDEGFYQLVNDDNGRKPLRDKNGDPILKPALLNGQGKPMSANQPPVFIRWRRKEQIDFSTLPFFR